VEPSFDAMMLERSPSHSTSPEGPASAINNLAVALRRIDDREEISNAEES